jgi:hypothetical protein
MTATTAADLFNLSVVARVEVDGEDWVLYDDGTFTDAVPASQFDDVAASYTPDQYSEWCGDTEATDKATLLAIMAEADLDEIWSGACGRVVRTEEVDVVEFFRLTVYGRATVDGTDWILFGDGEVRAAFDTRFDTIEVPTVYLRDPTHRNQTADLYAKWWRDSVFADDDQLARIEAAVNA